jgi:hypothetical protein
VLLRAGFDSWLDGGGCGSFVTVGLAHSSADSLEAMLSLLLGRASEREGGVWRTMMRLRQRVDGRAVERFKLWRERHSVVGWFRALEVTWNDNNGWNAHLHLAILQERRALDQAPLDSIMAGDVSGAGWVDDVCGWELVDLWCRAAERVSEKTGRDKLVTRYAYRDRYDKVRGPNHAQRLRSGGIGGYVAKVSELVAPSGGAVARLRAGDAGGRLGSWDVADEITSTTKRARAGGLTPVSLLRVSAGQCPVTVRFGSNGDPRERDVDLLRDVVRAVDWREEAGRKRAEALYCEFLRAFFRRHVLQPSRGFWGLLGASVTALDDSATLEESADILHGGPVVSSEVLGRLPAGIANLRAVQFQLIRAERELRAVLGDGVSGAQVDAAVLRFCERIEALAAGELEPSTLDA